MVKQVACSSVGSQRGDLIGWSLSAAIVVYFVHPRSDTERTPKTVTAGSAVEAPANVFAFCGRAHIAIRQCHVRYWHLTNMATLLVDVRFWG